MRMFAKKTFPEGIIFFWSNEEGKGERERGRGEGRFKVFDDGKIFIVCQGEWYFRFHIAAV